MSITAFKQVTSIECLLDAWIDLRNATPKKHRNTTGVDRESVRQFGDNADKNIRHLSADIRSGTYFYSGLKAHFELKPKGGFRVICIPTVKDRIVQRALLCYLTEHADPRYRLENKISYGFIKGRTVREAVDIAVKLRTKFPWVYKTDISSFFDQISRSNLRHQIERFIRIKSLHSLLLGAIDCEILPRDKKQKEKLAKTKIKKGLGVRQGMPLSPYFANLILRDFDTEIINHHIPAVRYADDLILFSESEAQCIDIHNFCRENLAKLGLSIPEIGKDKTVISAPLQSAEFLGVGLEYISGAYKIRLTDYQIADKKARLFKLIDNKYIEENKLNVADVIRKIDGKLDGWQGGYNFIDNLDQFSEKLRNWKIEALNRLFKEQLGLTALTKKHRKFLGIDPYG